MQRLLRPALGAAALTSLAFALHATRWAPYRPMLRKRRLDVPGSWPRLEILHVSDLHLRRSDPRLTRAQRDSLSCLPCQPDLVCVTGDLCETLDDVPLVVDVLGTLRPRFGMFLIPGNHEYAAGSPRRRQPGRRSPVAQLLYTLYRDALSTGLDEGTAIGNALRRSGLQVLRNEGVRLQFADGSLWLAGVDSAWADLADVQRAMAGKLPGEAALALVHEPELTFPAIEHGADLVLAGHTHGGQVRLPLVGPLYWHQLDKRLKVAAGVQRFGRGQLHISAGLGQLMPLRFLCPTEIVLITCVPAAKGKHDGRPLAVTESAPRALMG